jgi:hypothetical protein
MSHPRPLTEVLADDWDDRLREVTAERQRTEEAWRDTIRRAVAAGHPAAATAQAAGITRARVYQIRDGRR